MAELSCGGTLMGDTTSSASTRSKASNSGRVSVCGTLGTIWARKVLTASALSAWGS